MKLPRIRALVLAAGQGQRLRPLTGLVPKPLLPVLGIAVLERSLARLAQLGCEAVAINLHHLSDEVRYAVANWTRAPPITLSSETELLGTLGAFSQLRSFFGDAELILLINGDSLCHWPLRALVRRHLRAGSVATVLLSRRADPGRFGGGVGVDPNGRVVDFRPPSQDVDPLEATGARSRQVFAGAHVLSPSLLDRLCAERGKRDIVRDLYEPLLGEGEEIASHSTRERWHDLGTPERYLRAVLDAAPGRGPVRMWRRSWAAKTASVEKGARVRRSVLEAGVSVEARAVVEHSVLLEGARVGEGSRLQSSVVAPGVELPGDSVVARRLVTPLRAGRDPGARDSVVGRLVYTPIAPLGRETS